MRSGAYHLHGHQHNSADYNQASRAAGLRRFDVGVDANGLAPVSIQEILSFFDQEGKEKLVQIAEKTRSTVPC